MHYQRLDQLTEFIRICAFLQSVLANMSSVESLKFMKVWLALYSKLFGESLENGHGVMGLAALVVAVEENCYWGVI